MAETVYKAMVSMPGLSGDTDDVFVTDFHFKGRFAGPEADDADAIITTLLEFYTTPVDETDEAITAYLAEVIDTDSVSIKVYDLSDDRPRVPLRDLVTDIGAVSARIPLPSEVTLCISYRQAPASGVNRARSRGHVNIGPLATGKTVSGSGVMAQLSGSLITVADGEIRATLFRAAERMFATAATNGLNWIVFSPTTAGPLPPVEDDPAGWPRATLLAAAFNIEQARVDQTFDTLRSRGEVIPPPPWQSL